MLTKTFLSLVAAGVAAATPIAPLYPRDNTTTTNCPTPHPPTHKYFLPSATWTYDVGTGAINCAAPGGKVFKSDTDGGHDITTLLTFTYPPAVAGATYCQFEFRLEATDVNTGSQKMDLFTSLSPAPGCTSSWPPGNQRNINLGRLDAVSGGEATWEATYSTYLTGPTKCQAPGTVEGLELVGVYDNDDIEWSPYISGARIKYW